MQIKHSLEQKEVESEQLTTKEACIAENEDETLQVTKYL